MISAGERLVGFITDDEEFVKRDERWKSIRVRIPGTVRKNNGRIHQFKIYMKLKAVDKLKTRSHLGRRLLVLVGSLACLSFALVAQVPTTEGYYITIYSHTPTILWLVVGVALCLLPITVAIDGNRYIHAWGLFAAVGSILVAMPWLLGYYLYLSGDAFIIVGEIISILQSGHLQPSNFYPALHMIGTITSQITGIRPAVITFPLLLGFAAATSIGGAFLVSQFTSSKKGKYVGGILAPILLIGTNYTNFSPWAQSTPIILFALYALVRKLETTRLAYTVIAICFFFAAVVYHPLGIVVLLLIISVAVIIRGLLQLRGTVQTLTNLRLTHLWVLVAVSFIAWVISINQFLKITARSTIINLLGFEAVAGTGGIYSSSGGTSFIEQVLSRLQSTSPQIIDLFMLGLFRFGFDGLVLLAAAIAVLLGGTWQRVREMPQYYLLIVAPIPIFVGLGVVSMFLSLPIGFGRFIRVATLLSTIAIAAESGRVLTATSMSTIWRSARVLAVVCVLFVVLMTPFAVYGSSYDKTPNMQVTEMVVEGTEWSLDHKVDNSEVVAREMQMRRYSILLTGHQKVVRESGISPHFGYNSEQPVWYNRSADSVYLIVNKKGRIIYPKLYPKYRESWEFFPSDFEKVTSDPNVTVIYKNGEMAIYQANNSTQ